MTVITGIRVVLGEMKYLRNETVVNIGRLELAIPASLILTMSPTKSGSSEAVNVGSQVSVRSMLNKEV